MSLSNAEKKRFRAIGHKLHPIISIAEKGLSENIQLEIERALRDHELIKIKLLAADRAEKNSLTETICTDFNAECVQSIGHVILIFRAAKKPNEKLSNIKRIKI